MGKFNVFQKVYFALFILLILLGGGVAGYILIEGYNFLDAFYMTVITLSTVGFAEVKTLTEEGKIFTTFLIISSFGTFAYGISVISRSILSGEFKQHVKKYRLSNTIENLSGHIIICGFGRNGRRAARKLEAYGEKILVLENNEDTIQQFLNDGKSLYIHGDATSDDALRSAGIDRAKALISTLSKDSDNLYVVISAKGLNPDLRVITRASNQSAEKKLKRVGANAVVMPEGVGGAHMATLVVSPNIVEFLDFLSVEGSSSINLEEIRVSQLTDNIEGLKLKNLSLRQTTGCSIIGVKTPDNEYIINPGGDLTLTPNSRLFVLGKPEEIESLNKMLHE